ncbi:hypothetical protein, partial [Tautonia marina]|uniref:hypothetical protein n=1 Tax=Tautonia marina TaxID=2653855 RepID=UPI001F2655DF
IRSARPPATSRVGPFPLPRADTIPSPTPLRALWRSGVVRLRRDPTGNLPPIPWQSGSRATNSLGPRADDLDAYAVLSLVPRPNPQIPQTV